MNDTPEGFQDYERDLKAGIIPKRKDSLEARFHQNIKGLLSKTDQGRVMGAFRAALAGASDKAAPSTAERASDVRNHSDENSWPMRPWPNLEMRSTAYSSAFKYSEGDASRRQSFMAGAQWMSQFVEALEESNKQTVKAAQAEIHALKSATPVDKGNAPK